MSEKPAPGGQSTVVHLLHVVTRHSGADAPDPQACLRALIPPAARGRGIETCLEVVIEPDAYVGIVHAAGRLGVDAICMATHGHAGLSQLVLGSQAHAVVQRAWRGSAAPVPGHPLA